jgi:hypothetical protein
MGVRLSWLNFTQEDVHALDQIRSDEETGAREQIQRRKEI